MQAQAGVRIQNIIADMQCARCSDGVEQEMLSDYTSMLR